MPGVVKPNLVCQKWDRETKTWRIIEDKNTKKRESSSAGDEAPQKKIREEPTDYAPGDWIRML